MSCVHYKFKNSLDYETLTFDGLYISVEELKRSIYEKKRIGKSTDCDLMITNAQTKEVYDEDSNLIPRNSSVIVARVPAASLQKLPKVHDTRNEGTVNKAKMFGGNSSASQSAELPEKSNLAANDTLSEEDKIQRVLYDSSRDYQPGNYQKTSRSLMTGAPPPTYICHKCDQGGHWIANCPNPRKVRGIPRDELVETTQDDPRAMLTTSGTYVAQKLHQEAYANPKKDKPPVWEDEDTVEVAPTVAAAVVPKNLHCPLCKNLFTDAVIIPCCGVSFCDGCIRAELLESDTHQCPQCHVEDISPDNLVQNKFLRDTVTKFKNENVFSSHSVKAKSKEETLKLSLVRKPKSPEVIVVESSLRAHNAGVGASSFLDEPEITEVKPTVSGVTIAAPAALSLGESESAEGTPPQTIPEESVATTAQFDRTAIVGQMIPLPMPVPINPQLLMGGNILPPGIHQPPIHAVYPAAQPLPPGVSHSSAGLPTQLDSAMKPTGIGAQPIAPGLSAVPSSSRPLTEEEFYDKKQKLWESHKIDPLEEFQKFQEYRKKRDRTPASRSTSRSSASRSPSRSRSRSRSPRAVRKREENRRVRPRRRTRSPSRSKSPTRRGRPRSRSPRSTSRGRYRSRSRSTSRRRRRQRSFSRSRSRSRGRLPPPTSRILPYDFFTQAMMPPIQSQSGYNPANVNQFLQPPPSAYSAGFTPSVPPPQQNLGLPYPPRNVGPPMMAGIYGAPPNIPHFAGPLMQLPPPPNFDTSRFAGPQRFYPRPQRQNDSRWASRQSSSRYEPKSYRYERSSRRRSPADDRKKDKSPSKAERKADEKSEENKKKRETREERGEKSSRRRSSSREKGDSERRPEGNKEESEGNSKSVEEKPTERKERKKSREDGKERKRSKSPAAKDKVKSEDKRESSKSHGEHRRKRQKIDVEEQKVVAETRVETIVAAVTDYREILMSPKKELVETEKSSSTVPKEGEKVKREEMKALIESVKMDETPELEARQFKSMGNPVVKEETSEDGKNKHKKKKSHREEKEIPKTSAPREGELKREEMEKLEERKNRKRGASKTEDSGNESAAKKSSDEKKHKKHKKKESKKKKHRHHKKRHSGSSEPSA